MQRLLIALRVAVVVPLSIGVLFKLMHWPGAAMLLVLACGLALLLVLLQAIRWRVIDRRSFARDLVLVGLQWCWIVRALHWPGAAAGCALVAAGGLLYGWLLWRERTAVRGADLVFFAAKLILVVGVLFRLMHWPYADTILIAGLLAAGVGWLLSDPRDR